MKILKIALVSVVTLVLLIFITTYIYLKTTKPTYSGEISLTGLKEQVQIDFDNYGIPHIVAKNAQDAYFALGYVHAQDRLFQMEMLRRAAGGRLSEVLGKDFIKVDKLFRTLGLNVFADLQTKLFLSNDTSDFQKAALSYQKGINEYIRKGKKPLEFSIIGIPMTEFTPEDIYLAIGFMSFGFAEGIRTDPVLEKIKTELGIDYLKDLAVTSGEQEVKIRNFFGSTNKDRNQALFATIGTALEKIPTPLWYGSNGFVVAGNRTASGFPILANDTHIGYAQPAVWYEAHIEYPGFSLYGHHLAGVPFAMLGTNRFCAWGLTMFENDDTDFYVETVNPTNPMQVKYKDQWENISTRDEIIKVKGQKDIVFKVKSTRHGPIVNGILNEVDTTLQPITFWWLLNEVPNRSLQATYLLNRVSSFSQAQEVTSMYSVPGLNLMYADVDKNIAWWAVAQLPIRAPHVNTKFFLDGQTGLDEPIGYYDFSKNPQSINPPWGFVYSANNKPNPVDSVSYPGYYYPRSRAGRIEKLISENKKWTIADMQKIQLDVVSQMHQDIAKLMAGILKEINDPAFNEWAEALEKWDGRHEATDVVPSIYYNLLFQIMKQAMVDELGTEPFESFIKTSLAKNSYDILIGNKTSLWWDDRRTEDKIESRVDIVHRAAQNTLKLLIKTSGEKFNDWTWGKIHTLTHKHALASVKPLDKFFNVGPFTVGGGYEIINNLHFDLDSTGYFPVKGGPALRKVTDLGDLEHGVTISPTGQSGNVMSEFYKDQATMFVNCKYRPMLMNEKEIKESSKYHLSLMPSK